jgi:membrane protein required for colicin V production
VIGGFAWPDVAIAVLLVLATIKGFSRGFVRELGGIAALAAGLIAPRYYNGALDPRIASLTGLDTSSAHVAGAIVTGIAAYVIVLLAVSILGRIAKLPVIGTGNALAGAAVGLLKGAILVWIVLFVVQLFPLSPTLAASLRASHLVAYFTQFDRPIDDAIDRVTPPFARPLVSPLFDRNP